MTIVAKLKGLICPDVRSLEAFQPDGDFGIHVFAMVGPAVGEGRESFVVTVCTPRWFEQDMKDAVVLGRHHLFVKEFNYDQLHKFISEYCSRCMGNSWSEVAQKAARLGHWEFEDYKPFTDTGLR